MSLRRIETAGPGNPLASLQGQIDALAQQVAALGGATGIQDPAEPDMVMLRGTIGGSGLNPQVLRGSGFTVLNPVNVACANNSYPTYQVTFTPGTFSAPPSVVVSVHDFVSSPNQQRR